MPEQDSKEYRYSRIGQGSGWFFYSYSNEEAIEGILALASDVSEIRDPSGETIWPSVDPENNPQKEVLFQKLRRRFMEYEEAIQSQNNLAQKNAKRSILDEFNLE